MPSIFLSYRRADTGGYAGRLTDSLAKHFGKGNVFQDLEAIVPGSDFTRAIDAAIAQCQVLVVLIGDTWLTELAADGSPRLNDPHDFVRLEVVSGLRAATHVIPVLVEGAKMPAESALPDDLKPLARLQALELSDTRWEYDVDRLAKVVRALPGIASSRRRTYLLLAGAVVVSTLAAVAGYVASDHTPHIAGQWMLPNGSFWIVLQDGTQLAIEETHYESKQVWKRGTGTLAKQRVTFILETIYGPAHREDGTLSLSTDGRAMSGTISGPAGTARLALTRPH